MSVLKTERISARINSPSAEVLHSKLNYDLIYVFDFLGRIQQKNGGMYFMLVQHFMCLGQSYLEPLPVENSNHGQMTKKKTTSKYRWSMNQHFYLVVLIIKWTIKTMSVTRRHVYSFRCLPFLILYFKY